MARRRGFTLIELLVVIAIIVACWEGQNPRLEAKASAFLATRH